MCETYMTCSTEHILQVYINYKCNTTKTPHMYVMYYTYITFNTHVAHLLLCAMYLKAGK